MVDKSKPKGKPLDVVTLLSLPDQLRKTALVILKLSRATATMVARDTGREKTIENKYLTQLVKMGFLKLEKQDHDVYFYV